MDKIIKINKRATIKILRYQISLNLKNQLQIILKDFLITNFQQSNLGLKKSFKKLKQMLIDKMLLFLIQLLPQKRALNIFFILKFHLLMNKRFPIKWLLIPIQHRLYMIKIINNQSIFCFLSLNQMIKFQIYPLKYLYP